MGLTERVEWAIAAVYRAQFDAGAARSPVSRQTPRLENDRRLLQLRKVGSNTRIIAFSVHSGHASSQWLSTHTHLAHAHCVSSRPILSRALTYSHPSHSFLGHSPAGTHTSTSTHHTSYTCTATHTHTQALDAITEDHREEVHAVLHATLFDGFVTTVLAATARRFDGVHPGWSASPVTPRPNSTRALQGTSTIFSLVAVLPRTSFAARIDVSASSSFAV
jgi:hypothetical protein